MTVATITTSRQVLELADGLLDTRREQPWAVISIPENGDRALIDLHHLHEQVGEVCRIHTIKTGPLTRELESRLPERCQVYGGASRIYPTGDGWQTRPEESPLRFVHNPNQADATTEQLINDALGMASRAGLFNVPAPSSVHARGVVQKLLADNTRALVALDNGQYATIVRELTYPGIPLEWIIEEGQHVEGLLDPKTKRLTPHLARHDPDDLLQHYPHGSVTLAYVVNVERQSSTLAVHPAHNHTVSRQHISSNPFDRVDLLLAPGDVVPVRVIRDEQGRPALRLNDIDDDETELPALTLTPGGPPWLARGRHHTDDGDDTTDPARPSGEPSDASPNEHPVSASAEPDVGVEAEPGRASVVTTGKPKPAPGPHRATPTAPIQTPSAGATEGSPSVVGRKGAGALQSIQLALEQARRQIISLTQQLARAHSDSHLADTSALELNETRAHSRRLKDELRAAREEQRTQRAMLRSLNKQADRNSYAGRRERFDDDGEWMRHEVCLAWIDRLTPEDRRQHPLPEDYLIGESFVASFDSFDDPTKDKALKAVVDVLTGRARSVSSRAVHPLRVGDGANATDLVRADGARCMRAYIEQNVASARRLHYWVLDDNRIELSRIVTHDDTDP